MSPTLLYFDIPLNARAHKILALASLAGVALERKPIANGVDNETAAYRRNCHPLGRHPVLQTEEGYLFESNAIMRYIARIDRSNTNLYGRTPFEASEVDMWLDYCSGEINGHTQAINRHLFFGAPAPGEATYAALEESVAGLDGRLETRTFLVGERLTAADVALAFSLQAIYRIYKNGEEMSKRYKNVWRLYNTVMQQPKVVEVLASVGATFGIPKAAAAPKPAAAPKAAAPKAAAASDDEEEKVVVEKKPNPLDLLPPSPFVLDAFKREYSNNDTRTVAAPYFFENFDKEGYSAFWCTYKYNEENKMQFMTANFVRGWFQRMEHVRKYAFGISLIIGEEKAHDVVALWIFRGKGIPDLVKDVEDTELFTWEEIPDVCAQKEKITDYLCWEGPTIPKPVLEGRCFK